MDDLDVYPRRDRLPVFGFEDQAQLEFLFFKEVLDVSFAFIFRVVRVGRVCFVVGVGPVSVRVSSRIPSLAIVETAGQGETERGYESEALPAA